MLRACLGSWQGTELLLSEHRKKLNSAQRRHVGREFGQMPEEEAGGGRS